jgi:hypothetical protein
MTANKSSRPLSPGEVALAETMFGTAINYGRVHIHRRKWWPLQPKNWIMAPDGNLWVHPDGPLAALDFAAAGLGLRGLFIHEMTHVWQHQRRLCLLLRRHPFCRYRYRLEPGKPLDRYGVEQQAEIVRDAYLTRHGATRPGAAPAAAYAAVLPFTPRPAAALP